MGFIRTVCLSLKLRLLTLNYNNLLGVNFVIND